MKTNNKINNLMKIHGISIASISLTGLVANSFRSVKILPFFGELPRYSSSSWPAAICRERWCGINHRENIGLFSCLFEPFKTLGTLPVRKAGEGSWPQNHFKICDLTG